MAAVSAEHDREAAEIRRFLAEVLELRKAIRASDAVMKLANSPLWTALPEKQRAAHWRRIFAALAEAGAPVEVESKP